MTLNVAPLFDMATEYSARWNEQLMEDLDEPHTSLLGEDANWWNFNDHVKELDPDLVVFYDHGNETSLIGNDTKPLLDSRNVGSMRGREVYTMCCLAAKNLGPEAWRKGCLAWWGYTKVFSFVTTDEAIFCRLANMGLILLRKEHYSWEECITRVKAAYDEEIANGGNPWTVISLINDRDALVCWTDKNQPTSDCTFRNMAIKLFGTRGQKLSKSCVAAFMAYYMSWGYGIYSVCQLRGSLGGVCTTLGLMFVLPLVVFREYVKGLGRR